MDILTDESRLGLGGNNPPEPTPIEQTPLNRAADLVANANLWIRERERIEDVDQMSKAEGFIIQLGESDAALYAAMRAEKKPLEEKIDAIGEKYKAPRSMIAIALASMKAKKAEWLKWLSLLLDADKDNERFDAALAQRRAAEAAAKAASATATVEEQLAAQQTQQVAAAAAKSAAKPAEPARVSSDFSSRRSSLRTYWYARIKPTTDEKARIANEKEILTFMAKDPEGRAAMVAACLVIANKRAIAAKKVEAAPPGFEFYSDQKA